MSSRFSILHYNTLACEKADNSQYGFPYVSLQDVLTWDVRAPRILKRILRDRPDFICLQEVDRPDFFDKHLRSEGYDGVFVKKTNNENEGIAVYWNVKRFIADHYDIIQFGRIYKDDQSQVACFVHMSDMSNHKVKFIVGTTHLKAKDNPVSQHIRIMQCQALAKYLEPHIQNNDMSVILTGDMNDIPTSQPLRILRETGLRSAYMYDDTIVTTCKKRSSDTITKRMIDYIFYYGSHLQFQDVDKLPSTFPDIGLPSEDEPSDHLALTAVFEIVGRVPSF